MKKFEYNGISVEYDEKVFDSLTFFEANTIGDSNPAIWAKAFKALYCGRELEYDELLGYDKDAFLKLYRATIENAGETAKNSSDSQQPK